MKKIFSILAVCLLSGSTTVIRAQETPPLPVRFTSEDFFDQYWYNVNFQRKNTLFWTVDHTVSGEIAQKNYIGDDMQQWAFILVDEYDPEQFFYIVNKETREYVAYAPSPTEDSYGKPVPIVEGDGQVYYTDANVTTSNAAKFKFLYVNTIYGGAPLTGWSIICPERGGGTPYMNDRAGRNVCHYGTTDNGCIIEFTIAGRALVSVNASTLSVGALQGKTGTGYVTVTGANLQGDITATIEGPDQDKFLLSPGVLPMANKGGTLAVSFSSSELRTHSATLRLNTENGNEVTVALTGNVYVESDLPVISDEDNERWYYIQFARRAAENLVWSMSDTAVWVEQKTVKGGAALDQMWKICGDWETGYYIVNRESGRELLYNSLDTTGGFTGPNSEFPVRINPDFTADRFFLTTGYGNVFNFVRYSTTDSWQLYNRDVNNGGNRNTNSRYVYDSGTGTRYVSQTTFNSAGNELVFIPVTTMLKSSVPAVVLTAVAGETATASVSVIGLNTTGEISVSLTGAGADAFTLSATSFPAAGGELDITFTPASDDEFYAATLKLSSDGVEDLIIPVSGSYGGPILSTAGSDIWHYIQFKRQANNNKVWQANGMGNVITQVARVEGNYNQHWKLTGTAEGLLIENREGGFLFFPKNEAGEFVGDPNAVIDEDGDWVAIVYNEEKDEWEFKYLLNGRGLNDRSGSYICIWGLGDGGGPLYFFPVEATDGTTRMITTNASSVGLYAPVGETATATVSVSGIGLTEAVTATLTGADADKFTLAANTVPAEGGELTVTYVPAGTAICNATLTLGSPGAKSVTLSLTGNALPAFSTPENEAWYYVQFERKAADNKVWQKNAGGVVQAELEKDKESQHWKLVGDWNGGFVIENRAGGQIAFTDDDEESEEDLLAILAEEGTPVAFAFGNKLELQIFKFIDHPDGWGALNDYYGNEMCIYYLGDGGNPVTFIPEDGLSNIRHLSVDPADQLLVQKYYTLQGIEVKQPAATGIYIVKKVYASGKTQAVKEFVVVK